MEDAKKRTRRSKEQLTADKIAAKEAKIVEYTEKIEVLRKEIEELKNPPLTMGDIINTIQEHDIPLSEVQKALLKMTK